MKDRHMVTLSWDELEDLIAKARREQREQDALIAEDYVSEMGIPPLASDVATAIRDDSVTGPASKLCRRSSREHHAQKS